MKRIVILLVIVLLVVGGGGAAWWFLLREVPAEEGAEAEGAPDTENDDYARKRYVELEPIVLPIIREGQVTLHLTLVLAIELVTPISVVEVARLQRPLRDAVFTELHSIYALRYVQEKGFDHPIVRERLIRASGRVVGLGTVKAILVRKIGTQVPLRR